ncbi:cryptochrome/photolyase family protein [Microbulbifer agarilyticus]|uniref:cryptochrome/photolyase family protein n=1 Tax=Microbulbifer agarilyticus TaxID=260552 RepID=UPI001C9693F5|nr:cryptochrome/photolyase family protein [Microbulbifer agarilyticus]MBY6191711.1 cryptochrome/photolyase family protein [Microbulbifer agarilyticus]
MKRLRLILGDQLNHNHSWYRDDDADTWYFIAEMRQETDYARHHIQKVVAFFEAMTEFAAWLKARGKHVIHYTLDHPENTQNLATNIAGLVAKHHFACFQYQLPDEYRLDQQLKQLADDLSIPTEVFDSEHFLTERNALSTFFKGKKTLLMESFYRHMRKQHDILLTSVGEPEGGQWNFDQSNRKKWTGTPEIPHARGFRKNVTATVARLKHCGVETIGAIDPQQFSWPTSREDALAVLRHFCSALLPHFGDYQDAMHDREVYLFHSRLSFALNSKLLHPQEVIDKAIAHWRKHQSEIDISQIEGFVRQILGWREYMRGIYWKAMPDYRRCNRLHNHRPLPEFYWGGDTQMNCLHHAIRNSLDNAYAHHIQRLMITGNFALLAQVHPDQVEAWYLGIYIDAIEWVEMPNTRGMSQFADGGLVATKPYVSSGSYIHKMSNYCESCQYNVKERTTNEACPFNSLYWHFIEEKRELLAHNPRMSMMLHQLDKMSETDRKALRTRARQIIQNPDEF